MSSGAMISAPSATSLVPVIAASPILIDARVTSARRRISPLPPATVPSDDSRSSAVPRGSNTSIAASWRVADADDRRAVLAQRGAVTRAVVAGPPAVADLGDQRDGTDEQLVALDLGAAGMAADDVRERRAARAGARLDHRRRRARRIGLALALARGDAGYPDAEANAGRKTDETEEAAG